MDTTMRLACGLAPISFFLARTFGCAFLGAEAGGAHGNVPKYQLRRLNKKAIRRRRRLHNTLDLLEIALVSLLAGAAGAWLGMNFKH
jgi:hypothetical protein